METENISLVVNDLVKNFEINTDNNNDTAAAHRLPAKTKVSFIIVKFIKSVKSLMIMAFKKMKINGSCLNYKKAVLVYCD